MEPAPVPSVPDLPSSSDPRRSLADLAAGETSVVVGIEPGPMRRRLFELGFVSGTCVRLVRRAPLRDPLQVELHGYHLSVRVSEARGVLVAPSA